VEELRAGEEALRREVDEKKVHYFDIQTEKARLKNIVGTLSKNLEDLRRRAEKDSLDFSENETRSKAVAEELDTIRTELDASLKEFERLRADESGAMVEVGRVYRRALRARWRHRRPQGGPGQAIIEARIAAGISERPRVVQ